jgi:hypothetical protein
MQPTSIGPNRTPASLTPAALQAMNEAADELTPMDSTETPAMEEHKLLFAAEADPVGSIPTPNNLKAVAKTGIALVRGGRPTVLIDKLGERIAFERSGTRLYEALLLKFKATEQAGLEEVPPAQLDGNGGDPEQLNLGFASERTEQTLLRIRADEHAHFQLLCDAARALGADPTAMTPCADVAAVASSGIMQVLNEPRTTFAQCLNVMLTAELTDNAGWELLIQLAEEAGETELVAQFMVALAQEQEHLAIVKNWLTAIMVDEPKPTLI